MRLAVRGISHHGMTKGYDDAGMVTSHRPGIQTQCRTTLGGQGP